MRVSCPVCKTSYNIDEKRISKPGAKMKCARCEAIFPAVAAGVAAQSPSSTARGGPGAIPSTASSPAIALPQPRQKAPPPLADPDATLAVENAAIPLPGFPSLDEATAQNVLPEEFKPAPVPESPPEADPFAGLFDELQEPPAKDSKPSFEQQTQTASPMIPIDAFPVPDGEFQAVPLPGPSSEREVPDSGNWSPPAEFELPSDAFVVPQSEPPPPNRNHRVWGSVRGVTVHSARKPCTVARGVRLSGAPTRAHPGGPVFLRIPFARSPPGTSHFFGA